MFAVQRHRLKVQTFTEICLVKRYGCHERWGRGLKCRGNGSFNNNIKQRQTKTTPKGKNKQAGRQAGRLKTGAQSNTKLTCNIQHTKDNRSAQDCRHKENYIGRQTRVTRETQLEPLKQWLSNKMGGDRQSTWEHMAPTNNKPCALHTETSGGQPGQTSRTVTMVSCISEFKIYNFYTWVF